MHVMNVEDDAIVNIGKAGQNECHFLHYCFMRSEFAASSAKASRKLAVSEGWIH